MLLARHGWATAASSGRLGLGACKGERALSVLSKYQQWCFNSLCYRKMNFSRDWLNKSGVNKRTKTTAPVWRPTSNQSSSVFCSMESNDGNQPETKCHAASTSDSQYFPQIVEAASDFTEPGDQLPIEIFDGKELKEEISGDLNCGATAVSASNNDRHSLPIEVGSLARFVKGKCGFTQRRIEEEFGVKIIFPTSKKESSIVIEGVSSDGVTGALEKIKNILEEAIKSGGLDYSHFVSLPLAVHGELVEKVTDFQNTILDSCIEDRNADSNSDEDCNDNDYMEGLPEGADVAVKLDVQEKQHIRHESDARSTNKLGIEKSIFLKPKQLHLTVLMLKLHKKDRIDLAAEVLQKISSKVVDALDHRPLSIRLKGLACMRGSPAKAHVVYAPVEEIGGEERLLRACQVIIDAYLEAGLALKQDAEKALKLHATLMNTRQRKRRQKERKRLSVPFDARDIFKKYGSMEWGEFLLPEVHLSQRFLYDDNGYYHCCGSIPLPGSIVSE